MAVKRPFLWHRLTELKQEILGRIIKQPDYTPIFSLTDGKLKPDNLAAMGIVGQANQITTMHNSPQATQRFIITLCLDAQQHKIDVAAHHKLTELSASQNNLGDIIRLSQQDHLPLEIKLARSSRYRLTPPTP